MEFLQYFPPVGLATGIVFAIVSYDIKWRSFIGWLLAIAFAAWLVILTLWLLGPRPVNFNTLSIALDTIYYGNNEIGAALRAYLLAMVLAFLGAWTFRLFWTWSRQQNAPS